MSLDNDRPYWNKIAPFLGKKFRRGRNKTKLIKAPASKMGKATNVIGENWFVPISRPVTSEQLNLLMARFYKAKHPEIGRRFRNGYFWTPDRAAGDFLVRVVNLTGSCRLTDIQRRRGRGVEIEILIFYK